MAFKSMIKTKVEQARRKKYRPKSIKCLLKHCRRPFSEHYAFLAAFQCRLLTHLFVTIVFCLENKYDDDLTLMIVL